MQIIRTSGNNNNSVNVCADSYSCNENDTYNDINQQITTELHNLKRRIEVDGKTPENMKEMSKTPLLCDNPTSFLVCGYDYDSYISNPSFPKVQEIPPTETIAANTSASNHTKTSAIRTPTLYETMKPVTTTIVTPTIII